jgi:hypothetical protein
LSKLLRIALAEEKTSFNIFSLYPAPILWIGRISMDAFFDRIALVYSNPNMLLGEFKNSLGIALFQACARAKLLSHGALR